MIQESSSTIRIRPSNHTSATNITIYLYQNKKTTWYICTFPQSLEERMREPWYTSSFGKPSLFLLVSLHTDYKHLLKLACSNQTNYSFPPPSNQSLKLVKINSDWLWPFADSRGQGYRKILRFGRGQALTYFDFGRPKC